MKSKNVFAEGFTPNCSQEVFVINKIKDTVPMTYVITDLIVKKSLKLFVLNNSKRLIEKIRIRKVIKRKGNELFVKCKCYDNSSFICWIDKSDLI